MYTVKFFKSKNGDIPVLDYINNLEEKSIKNKNARIKKIK